MQEARTYDDIIAWIENKDVDVLYEATECDLKPCKRDEKGHILNRPPFLFGKELPAESSHWWGGGEAENDSSSSEEDETTASHFADTVSKLRCMSEEN